MQSQIHYGHIGRTEALENYVREGLEKLTQKSVANDSFRFEVWMESINGPVHAGAPLYTASIRAVSPRGEDIFVKKQESNFFRAFRKCQEGMLKQLRRVRAEKKRRRHNIEIKPAPTLEIVEDAIDV